MGYMTVESHSHTRIHLKRLPGFRSWALLVGISSVGLSAAYYSSDSWMWKLFYVAGCCFVAIQNLEEWELLNCYTAYIKHSTSADSTSSVPPYHIPHCISYQPPSLGGELNHLRDVSVEEEKVRYLGKGYLVVLRFATGFSHPLTQSATLGGRSDADAIADLLKRFLGLDKAQQWEKVSDSDSSDSDQSNSMKTNQLKNPGAPLFPGQVTSGDELCAVKPDWALGLTRLADFTKELGILSCHCMAAGYQGWEHSPMSCP